MGFAPKFTPYARACPGARGRRGKQFDVSKNADGVGRLGLCRTAGMGGVGGNRMVFVGGVVWGIQVFRG